MPPRVFAAVDIGASGGRVIAGVLENGWVSLHPIHRFVNGVHRLDGHLRWDLKGLYEQVLIGLQLLASQYPQVESVGIDTWAVDYGLLGAEGALLEQPIAYRDDRTDAAVIAEVHARVSPAELYAINGLQFLPFNTLYQLQADRLSPRWKATAHVVLLPDLLAYWLTGVLRTEATNASTTGLLDARTGRWSSKLHARLDLSAELFPALESAGAVRGPVSKAVCYRTGLSPRTVVTAVGSHDTASAVVALPARSRRFAYAASGTWSLVGQEVDEPILSDAARTANFTNEGGIDGRTRFLRNVGGLWLLQESLRTWAANGQAYALEAVLAEAAALPPGGPRLNVDDPAFIAPGDMPQRIAAAVTAQDERVPTTAPEVVRCIIDSLASAYARVVTRTEALSGCPAEVIHVVGGGARNTTLCQLTADFADRPVTAGPVEATALGNILVQARAHGALPGTLEEIRERLAGREEVRWFYPQGMASA